MRPPVGLAVRQETSPDAPPKPQASAKVPTIINVGRIEDFDPDADTHNELWYGDTNNAGIAQRMIRDPHVRKAVEAITDPLEGARWRFRPASKDPVDVEAADFANWVFFEHKLNWPRMLRQLSQGYVRDGFALGELTDRAENINVSRFPNHPGRGRGVVYDRFRHIPGWSLDSWIQDPDDPECADGLRQYIPGSDEEETGLNEVKFSQGDLLLRATWDQESGDYSGLAIMRSAYFPWFNKRVLQIVDAMRHETEGKGIPTVNLPENAGKKERETAEEILRTMRAHEEGYIVLPNGFTFKFTTTNGQSTGIREAIEMQNRDIAYAFGVAWMLLGLSGKSGSWALATEQKGQYALSLEKHARFIERLFNMGYDRFSPVERLIRKNYGPDVGLPRIEAQNMPTRDWIKLLPILPSLVSAKLVTPDQALEDQIRVVLDLPQMDPETIREVAAGSVQVPEMPEDEPEDDEADEELGQVVSILEALQGRVEALERSARQEEAAA